jgi:hypothetical protein
MDDAAIGRLRLGGQFVAAPLLGEKMIVVRLSCFSFRDQILERRDQVTQSLDVRMDGELPATAVEFERQ